MPKLIFVDSGVLIAAARGIDPLARRALALLADPDVRFAASIFVRLEVLPKALYHRRQAEARLYERYFLSVAAWAEPTSELLLEAYNEAIRAGLASMDALHVAAAAQVGALELIATERRFSPILRATLVQVRTIAT